MMVIHLYHKYIFMCAGVLLCMHCVCILGGGGGGYLCKLGVSMKEHNLK